MQCANCGAGAIQGSDGSWTCLNQCGWSGVAPAPTTTAVSSQHGYAADAGPGATLRR